MLSRQGREGSEGSRRRRLGGAEVEDGGAEFSKLFCVEATDVVEVGEGAGFGEGDVAEGGVGEDEEAGKAGGCGLLLAPVAEFGVEGLLRGGEFDGLGWRRGGAFVFADGGG